MIDYKWKTGQLIGLTMRLLGIKYRFPKSYRDGFLYNYVFNHIAANQTAGLKFNK